jgi:hypothetical protein
MLIPLVLSVQSALQFVPSPLQTEVWLPVASAPAASGAPAAPSPGVRALPGFSEPAALDLDGTLLYVSENGGAQSIRVVDIAIPGLETVVGTYSSPVDPVDVEARGGWLYTANQKRNPLWYRPLGTGNWSSLPLPNGTVDEWTYGELLEPQPGANRMLVLHMWENKIDVVDLAGPAVVHTITDLHHLPTRARFTADGQRLVVLCTGLSAPSCGASGPNLAVFETATWQKLYEINLSGKCWYTLQVVGGRAFANHGGTFEPAGITAFDLAQGNLIESSTAVAGMRNMASNGRELFLQGQSDGSLQRVDDQLTALEENWQLLANPQIWFPPTENIFALEPCDGRVFIANRNDGSLSIVDGPQGFVLYGAGCAGSGGFVPALVGSGCATGGATVSVTLKRGLGGSLGILLFGTGVDALPLAGGCTLLLAGLSPGVITLPLTPGGPGAGQATLTATLGPAPSGALFTLQGFVLDAGVPGGFSASNALRGAFP